MSRILIAEDSDTEWEDLRLILQETSPDRTIIRDGLETEAAVKSAPLDLIILDVSKPCQQIELLRTIEQPLGASQ